jgi:hypothetical protein
VALREHGIEVRTFDRPPSRRELAAAALALRKQHPRLTLAVAGPPAVVRELERRYPALVDVTLHVTKAAAVIAALIDDRGDRPT